jgi:5-hydroxyisourate hydrolase-like protein (transthyretin family)
VRKTQAYYANTLKVQMVENYGQLLVTQAQTGKAVPGAYVKVYAKMKDNTVKFFKDGYTDLRGRFDYVSLNTNELEDAQRLAVLVMSDAFGAVVREAPPPKR